MRAVKPVRAFWVFLAFLTSLTCLRQPLCPSLSAQEQHNTEAILNEQGASPKTTLNAFMSLAASEDLLGAAVFLDSRLSKRQRLALVPKLFQLLDQRGWMTLSKVSNASEGNLEDHLNPNVDVVGYIRTEGAMEPILLKRSVGKHEEALWQFDADFLKKVPELFDTSEQRSVKKVFPAWMQNLEVLGLRAWQWLAMLLALLLSYILAALVAKAVTKLARKLAQSYKIDVDAGLFQEACNPIKYLIFVPLFQFFYFFLEMPFIVRSSLQFLEALLFVSALTILALKSAKFLIFSLRARLVKTNRIAALTILPVAQRVLNILILVVALAYVLQTLGVNVTAILAGLGLGGVAVALGGQKTMENLLGGISVIIDQPVRVGDFCRFGDGKVMHMGTVEDIGLRSTRVRTLDRTLIAIPNAEFAQMQLENFGKRDQVLLRQNIALRYDTSTEKMRELLQKLEGLFLSHPMVVKEGARVRFVAFGSYALEVELNAYIRTDKYDEYLKIKEELNLKVIDLVSSCGLSFAFPSQTVYWEAAKPLENTGRL